MTQDAPPPLADDFSTVFAAAAPVLLAWAHLRVRGVLQQRIEPEDLVQEVAVRAFQKRADFDPQRGPFRAWLLGFANRVWLEALRAATRDPMGARMRHGGDSQLPQVPDSVTAVSQRLARDERFVACLAQLSELDETDRRLVACIGLEGLGHVETATVLGIAHDACRKRWQRLRERLQVDPVLATLLLP